MTSKSSSSNGCGALQLLVETMLPSRWRVSGARNELEARSRLRVLLRVGVTSLLDLTEEGESGWLPYAYLLGDKAASVGQQIVHRRMPIRDLGLPSVGQMRQILDTMDVALHQGRIVYLHCWS